jgi:hypothetical protein
MCVALPATPCPLLVSKTCKRRKNDQHCPMEHRRQRKCIYIWVKERRRVLEKWTPFDTELNPISIQQHGRRGAGHSILVIQLRGPMGVVLGKSWRVIGEEEMRRRQRRRKITTFFSRGPGSSILIGLDFHSRDFWQRAVFLWKKYAKNKCIIHLKTHQCTDIYGQRHAHVPRTHLHRIHWSTHTHTVSSCTLHACPCVTWWFTSPATSSMPPLCRPDSKYKHHFSPLLIYLLFFSPLCISTTNPLSSLNPHPLGREEVSDRSSPNSNTKILDHSAIHNWGNKISQQC